MKVFGLQRKLDNTGRIVLPSEYRKELDFNQFENLEISLVNDGILIKKPQSSCKLCGQDGDLITFKGSFVCFECISELKKKSL